MKIRPNYVEKVDRNETTAVTAHRSMLKIMPTEYIG